MALLKYQIIQIHVQTIQVNVYFHLELDPKNLKYISCLKSFIYVKQLKWLNTLLNVLVKDFQNEQRRKIVIRRKYTPLTVKYRRTDSLSSLLKRKSIMANIHGPLVFLVPGRSQLILHDKPLLI